MTLPRNLYEIEIKYGTTSFFKFHEIHASDEVAVAAARAFAKRWRWANPGEPASLSIYGCNPTMRIMAEKVQ